MKITDVRVRKMTDGGKLKGVASITFDDEFVVHDIKIIEGDSVKVEISPYDLTKGRIVWRDKN